MSFDAHQLDVALLAGSAITLLAILAVRATARAGLPSLLLYLLIGVLLGESGVGIQFEDAAVAHALGFGALAVILAEGGLTTQWSAIKPGFRLGVSLATVGMAVSVAIVAVGAHYLLGLSWELAILLGAATSATDAAAVFSVLRVVPLPRRVTGVLEAESGLNDAPTVVLVTLVASGAAAEHGWLAVAGLVVYELTVGILFGFAIGLGGAWVMRRAALPSSGLYPLAVMALCILAYAGGAVLLHASGFAAVYVAALVLGNSDLPHRVATRSFAEGIAWLAQIGLFVMLGLLLSPDRISLSTVGLALASGLLLTLVARPVSVLVSALAQRMPANELAFVSWAGLRGAVPIVFATIPMAEGVDGADTLFDIIFVMVVAYTLLTGPTLPYAARLLRVAQPQARELDVEAAPLERIDADLLQVRITRQSRMHGVEVGELRLPAGASVSLVIRDGDSLVPERRTVLRRGDELLVVTPRRLRGVTEDRLRAVARGGRLAQWLGTSGSDD